MKTLELSIEIVVDDEENSAEDILIDVVRVIERRWKTLNCEVVRDDRGPAER